MLDLFQISKLDGPLPEAKRRCLDRNSTLFFEFLETSGNWETICKLEVLS